MPGHQGAATVPLHRRDVPSSHGAYKRAHRGDKIVDYGTSLFAPQGYAAIFYLRHRNADGSYASGGVAYYCHTRRVSKPAHDAVYGFDAVARMTAVSHGTARSPRRARSPSTTAAPDGHDDDHVRVEQRLRHRPAPVRDRRLSLHLHNHHVDTFPGGDVGTDDQDLSLTGTTSFEPFGVAPG
jgi:hypothetical protein